MASFDTTTLLQLLNTTGLQQTMPALYNLLTTLIGNVDGLSSDLITVQSVLNPGGAVAVPSDVTNFTVTVNSTNVTFNWSESDFGDIYEIRQGTVWETANFVTRTVGLSAVIDPLLVGTYTYLIKSINNSGTYSTNATSVSLTINSISGLVLTVGVIDNTVTFNWNAPTSQFAIDHYLVKRDGTEIGIAHLTFFSLIESSGGTKTYSVQAVDVAGNISPITTGSQVTVLVQTPSDYVLKEKLIDNFGGTKTNVILDMNGYLLGPVNTAETWADHFSTRTWTDVQDQINAGYPIYDQPSDSPGSYQTIFDFGSSFSNVLIQFFLTTNPVAGTVNFSYLIESSPDNVTWTSQGTSTNVFISSSFRYIRFTITFTATDATGLIEITSLIAELFVRTFLDSGSANIFAADVGGTLVDYNVSFQNVLSITTSPSIVQPMYLIVNSFTNTGFHVSATDASGNRVNTTIDWKAIGVLNT